MSTTTPASQASQSKPQVSKPAATPHQGAAGKPAPSQPGGKPGEQPRK